jgi:hypothetical protein
METHQEAPIMTTSIEDTSDCDSYSLKSNATWDLLYHFIRSLVTNWVHSSHIPLWHGQEEEVTADIVQETMMKTFKYVSKFSLWIQEGEMVSRNALESIGKAIALTQYQHFSRQDSRFVHIRSRKCSCQGYTIIHERFDPLEMVIDDTFQEWCCDHLASEIAEIPPGPRTELLIYLANHICFDVQISQSLQSAFLKRGIQLHDYQRSLPANPGTRSKQKKLLRQAHKRIMRKQEKLNKLQKSETVYVDQKLALASNKQSSDTIIDDPELAALVAELEVTAPFAIVDPAFRRTLRDDLLDIQAEYYVPVVTVDPLFRKALCNKLIEHSPIKNVSEAPKLVFNDASGAIIEESNEKGDDHLVQTTAPDDPDADATGGDLGLTILLACLRTDIAFVDPIFQSTLRNKIAENPLLDYALK